MASRDLGLRPAASIRAGLVLTALLLGIIGAVARADNSSNEPQQPDADAQRTEQTSPPARVILPAPWEQATPAPPVARPAVAQERK